MKCENCLFLLDEYIEKELDQEVSRQIEIHISDCPNCQNFYHQLLNEQKVYSSYISEFKTSANLWSNVQAEIEEKNKHKNLIQQFIASIFYAPKVRPVLAGLISLFVIGVLVFSLFYKLESRKEVAEIKKEASPKNTLDILNLPKSPAFTTESGSEAGKIEHKIEQKRIVKIAFVSNQKGSLPKQTETLLKDRKISRKLEQPQLNDEVIRAENEFLKAIAILSREITQKQQKLSAQGKSEFNDSLKVLDKTIAETRRAVRRQPNDPLAIQYMSAAYSKKVELLRMITEE